jgi:hypothetical protein
MPRGLPIDDLWHQASSHLDPRGISRVRIARIDICASGCRIAQGFQTLLYASCLATEAQPLPDSSLLEGFNLLLATDDVSLIPHLIAI